MTALIIAPTVVFAQSSFFPAIVPPACQGPEAAKSCDICQLGQLGQNLINTMIYLMVPMAAVLFAFAGWIYSTAGGNEGKVQRAHDIFYYVFLGLVVTLAAWLIVHTIITTLTGSSFSNWNIVCENYSPAY